MAHLRKYWVYHLLFWLATELFRAIQLLTFKQLDSKFELSTFFGLGHWVINLLILFFLYVLFFLFFSFIRRKRPVWLFVLLFTVIALLYAYVSAVVATEWVFKGIANFALVARVLSFVYTATLFAGFCAVLETIARQRQLMALQKAHDAMALDLLKSQVNPHFLMNTLYNIYATVKNQSPEGGAMLLRLGSLLHYSQQAIRLDAVPLEKEVEYLANYIALEKIRLSGDHTIRFTSQVADGAVAIAPMLLINFVENAFKHGLGEMTEPGYLYVDVALQGKELFFVAENARPFQHKRPVTQGTGLQNVRQRLQLLYPDRHRLTIEDEEAYYKVTLEITLQ